MTAPKATADASDALDLRLEVLRSACALQRQPARFHVVAALARRRAGQTGVVRAQLDRRLAQLLDDLQQRLAAPAVLEPVVGAAATPPPLPGPLARLCAELVPAGDRRAPLRTVQQFAGTWARLRVDQQLHRASGRQQAQAGPLNSQKLMLQALQQLRQLSPAYLQRFMAQAETLLWLDDLGAAADSAAAAPAPAPRRRAPARRPAR
jgi:hypothetical protein